MADGRDSITVIDDGDESPNERYDRNWAELRQELRVLQTGTQILAVFLLTLPFQQRFTELGPFDHILYLVLVLLAAVITAARTRTSDDASTALPTAGEKAIGSSVECDPRRLSGGGLRAVHWTRALRLRLRHHSPDGALGRWRRVRPRACHLVGCDPSDLSRL